jgi:outer membrane protein OmpA-like peptidoglycan-associated protein
MMTSINRNISNQQNTFSWLESKSKIILFSILLVMPFGKEVSSQETVSDTTKRYSQPSWWFGVSGAANFNFYDGSTHQLTTDFAPPVTFTKGFGVGLFLGPVIEYHKENTVLGFMFQAGYDSRKGKFDQKMSPCNCPADLKTNLSYISIEPNLRVAPFKGDFYLYAGPRLAFAYSQDFVYKQDINPEFPEQIANPDVEGEFSDMKKYLISMQIGAGYDIQLSSARNKTKFILSPYVSFHPYFGNTPRDIETWNITTIRTGATLKFGVGKNADKEAEKKKEEEKADKKKEEKLSVINAATTFAVYAPKNIPAERTVRESFPLRNHIYFDLNSTKISDRYVLLEKSEVANFKEEDVQLFTPKNMTGRSKRQLVVYYNALNILGDRMGKNPSANIKLVGTSENGYEEGILMAESVKTYLVEIFGIAPSRISTEGNITPSIPGLRNPESTEKVLLLQGDRRVTIESNSPALLIEFQSGPDAPLKPVEILAVEEAPVESYVTFNVPNSRDLFASYIIEITDDKGTKQTFGPYMQDKVAIPGKQILGTRESGDYKVKMIGTTNSGKTVEKEEKANMVLWKPAVNDVALRFSILYEFNDNKAIRQYEKYITDIIVPKIPKNGKVIIHGHSDVIGNEIHNQMLSESRANDAHQIFLTELKRLGRNDVQFTVHGYGEEESLSPFENKYPEERSYNRTVVIDIVPPTK